MTRVNLIDPVELYDQHLIAEYRELRLLTANLKRILSTEKGRDKRRIPSKFTLNAGHVLFFSDKGRYITNRYSRLQREMVDRGFIPSLPTLDVTAWPPGFFNDWTPSEDDMNIVRERIALRVSQRPGWYRYRGNIVGSK